MGRGAEVEDTTSWTVNSTEQFMSSAERTIPSMTTKRNPSDLGYIEGRWLADDGTVKASELRRRGHHSVIRRSAAR